MSIKEIINAYIRMSMLLFASRRLMLSPLPLHVQPWSPLILFQEPCWQSISVWSNKVTGSGRHSSGSGRSGGEAVRWSRTNPADSGRVPQTSRLISNVASKQPKPQKKTMHLFINLLLVTVCPQPLWWEELGSVRGIYAFLFKLVWNELDSFTVHLWSLTSC